MTVNERLYVLKLDKQFDDALGKDHIEVGCILIILGVDSDSIETILQLSVPEYQLPKYAYPIQNLNLRPKRNKQIKTWIFVSKW